MEIERATAQAMERKMKAMKRENPYVSGVRAVESLLVEIGEDVTRDGLLNTPKRVVKALKELTEGYSQDPEQILSARFEVPYDEIVIVKNIHFTSLCEHHMLPFQGQAHVGYLPGDQVVGLSKIARLVHCFAKRLQIQERLTQQIAHAMRDHLEPQGVGVVIEASHLCMSMRGVKTTGQMTTSCLLGELRTSGRSEFLRLIGK